MSARIDSAPLSAWGALTISVLFWCGLGVSAVLYAALLLSPRCLQYEQLRLRYQQNAAELMRLRQTTEHLSQVAHALRTDQEFLARVAASELSAVPVGGTHVPVGESLGYDARIPARDRSLVTPATLPWYVPVLETLAQVPEVRLRCLLAAAILLGLSFVCLNEAFFAGGAGAVLRRAAACLSQRYAARPVG